MPDLPLHFGELLFGSIILKKGIDDVKGGFASSSSSSGGTVTGTPTGGGIGGGVLPVSGPNVQWERTDQGIDANTGQAGDPIRAVTAGVVTGIVNFYNGQPAVIVSSSGLPGGATGIYYAEGITPTVHVGQHVVAGQQIGTTTSQPTGLEFGFWKGTSTLAQATTGYVEGEITAAGRLFHNWLGVPGAIT